MRWIFLASTVIAFALGAACTQSTEPTPDVMATHGWTQTPEYWKDFVHTANRYGAGYHLYRQTDVDPRQLDRLIRTIAELWGGRVGEAMDTYRKAGIDIERTGPFCYVFEQYLNTVTVPPDDSPLFPPTITVDMLKELFPRTVDVATLKEFVAWEGAITRYASHLTQYGYQELPFASDSILGSTLSYPIGEYEETRGRVRRFSSHEACVSAY